MSLSSQAKKPFVWICVIATLCCVLLLHQNSSGIYEFAVNSRYGLLNSTRPTGLPDGSLFEDPCEQETSCRMKRLRERIRHVCLSDRRVEHYYDKKQSYGGLLNHNHRLLYFPIAKVGCSFWKRIIKVLNDKSNSTGMFDIPNYKAHTGKGLVHVNSIKQVNEYIDTYTSFLFVRDPFSRLFSGYIDKMFVPNPIAVTHGKAFFSRYRSTNGNKNQCELNISFGDFALYMADRLLGNRMSDPHFYPMSRHLNPCDVNITYVAKMEHFMDDTNYILSSVGVRLDDVSGAKGDDFDAMHEKGYMEDIINRTFNYLRRGPRCITPRTILQRLWTTFYIRGYLLKSQKMPSFKQPALVQKEQFVKATRRAYDSAPNSKEERSKQRKEAMMEAYSLMPRSTLKKLSLAFGMDCRVFQYSCNVDELFPWTKSIRPFYFDS